MKLPVILFIAMLWTGSVAAQGMVFQDHFSAFPAATPGESPEAVAVSGIPLPYVDSFSTAPGLWTSDTAQPGSDWELGSPTTGVTSGCYTPPNCWDVRLFSLPMSNTHAYLYSPVFDYTAADNNVLLSFWRNNNVQQGRDGYRIEYCQNQNGFWSILGYRGDPRATNWYDTTIAGSIPTLQESWSGNTGTWIESTYLLQQFNGFVGELQFRFVFDTDAFGNLDGASIDNFSLLPPQANDLELTSLKTYKVLPSLAQDTVKIRFQNQGSATQYSFNLNYSVSGGPAVSEPFAIGDSLAPGEFRDFTFSTTYTVPQGVYAICAWVDLPGDSDPTNDTLCGNIIGLTSYSLPYADDFNSFPPWFQDSTTNPGTQWEWGTPGYGATTGALSHPRAWDVNLFGPYASNSVCILTSPFFDFTNQRDVTLRFQQNRNVVSGEDGIRLEYNSTLDDSGWQLVDTTGNIDAKNWYNGQLLSSGQPGWSGNSGGWKQSRIVLKQLDSAGAFVRFRFVFSSYIHAPADGVSIDDFSLIPAARHDLSAEDILYPDSSGAQGTSASVTMVLENVGTDTATSCQVVYKLNGIPAISDLWTGSLGMYEKDTLTFTTLFTVPFAIYDICVYIICDTVTINNVFCKSIFPNPPLGISDRGGNGTFELYPNPVQSLLEISYQLPAREDVTVKIFDVTGRLVQSITSESTGAGLHHVVWNTNGEPSGIYFVQLKTASYTVTKKAVVYR